MLVPIRKDKNQDAVPTNADLTRFLERRRAQKLGFELPMSTEEAAAYVGYHPKTVERMARMGRFPRIPCLVFVVRLGSSSRASWTPGCAAR